MSFFLPNLKKSDRLNNMHITICNVGSRKTSDRYDYGALGWQIFAPHLSIYGFDADADACAEANADLASRSINWQEQQIPLALGNTVGEATLYVTKHPMCSSLFVPNEPYLSRFSTLLELAELDFTVELETTTLDNACQAAAIETIDFLQVDVQGADLMVLEGATELLSRSILALQIEVEFSPLYVDQPLFADVDSYVRNQGFTLFDLTGAARRVRARSPISSSARPGQLLWSDALYFRDLLQPDRNPGFKTPAQLLKLACIADVLDFPDYTLELLEYLTLQYGQDETYNFADLIAETFSEHPALLSQGLGSFPVITQVYDYLSSAWQAKI